MTRSRPRTTTTPAGSASRLALTLAAAAVVLAAAAAGQAAGRAQPAAPTVPGTWQRLPPAPIAPAFNVLSVWTGRQLLVFGRAQPAETRSVDVAAAYTPATRTWRALTPFPGPRGNYEGRYWAVWTGTEMLVVGPLDRQAYNPATNRWRKLPKAADVPGGIVVWTGRELIGWGGGCCGDATAEGAAYDPATNTRRTLARSPLAPEQSPIGVWTGRELVLFVSGANPADGQPWPARLARAAAYDPATDTWRLIAPLPAVRWGPTAVWDGREMLVVGGTGAGRGNSPPAPAAVGLAYAPRTNRWRRLPAGAARVGAAAVWTGRRLLVWGGTTTPSAVTPVTPNRGLALAPGASRWSALPGAPLLGRFEPTAVWTGNAMIVWGGGRSSAGGGTRFLTDGAAFRPARP